MIIPNPYLEPETPVSIQPFKKRNKSIVMAAARIEPEKGFDTGIKAMSYIHIKYPDYVLNVYGKGDFWGLYGTMIKEYGLDKCVVFHGLSNNILEDIATNQIFMFPSRVEGIPNMLIEALGLGLPCVGCDCPPGGVRLLIGDNERGMLVEVDDSKKMADCVCSIIASEELANKLEKSAQEIKTLFSAEKISSMWCKCVANVVKSVE